LPLLVTRPRCGGKRTARARSWLGCRHGRSGTHVADGGDSLDPPTPHVTWCDEPSWLVRRMPPRDVGGMIALRHQPLRLLAASRLLAAPRRAPAACRGFTSAEHVGRSEMVPATTLTDLDHVDPEFAVFGCHLGQFGSSFDSPRVLSEFVPVHVGDVREVVLAADGAANVGWLAVKLGRSQQVRVRVADVGERRVARVHGRERRTPGKPVIHNRTARGHAPQGTSAAPTAPSPDAQPVGLPAEPPVAWQAAVAYAVIVRFDISNRDIG
jgi:hypothetical protein